jgi:hypothetical protein
MASVRFTDLQARSTEFLAFTSWTLDEFPPLVPPFEAVCHARMVAWRLDGKGSVTKRFRCIPVPSTYACKTQGKVALWPRVAIKRCGQSKAWHAVAGMWTSMGMGTQECACALLWSFSRRQEVRPMRKTRHQCHVKMRSRAPSEPWLASNLCVTLPIIYTPAYDPDAKRIAGLGGGRAGR